MKTKARKIAVQPPGSLELAVDKLQLAYGPLALDTVMRNRLRHRGRRLERSVKTKLMVWSLVEEWSRRHKRSISEACHFAASHWVICDMNEFVGGLVAPPEAIERCQYPHSTWRRIHAEASKHLAVRPEEKARQDQFLEMFLGMP